MRKFGIVAGVATVLAAATVFDGVAFAGETTGGAASGQEMNAGKIDPAAKMPAIHPPIPQQAESPPARTIKEGKVQSVPKTQKFVHYRVGDKNVKSIYMDGKVAWIGTSGGAIRYDTETDDFKLYDATNGLLSNGVFHIGKVKGRIAVGTYGGGMSLFDAKTKTWETFNISEGLGDAFVYDFLELKNGDIWIATWSGANRVRGGALHDRSKWELYTVANTNGGLPNDWVYGLAAGKHGEVWMATEGGLARYKNGKWDNWNHSRGLGADYDIVKDHIDYKSDPSLQSSHHATQKSEMGLQGVNVAYNPNYVIAIQVARDGTVWVGTWGGGLAHFNGKKWKNYTVADGLPSNHVFMVHVDRKGRVWAGTGRGLARVKSGKAKKGAKFSVMTTEDGLLGDAVFSMAMGKGKGEDMWVGSFGGVAHIRNAKMH